VKVAFFQDLTIPDASQLVTPSLLALELALERAAERNDLPVAPEVEGMDTEGDPDRQAELARQIVDDPAFIAVVEGPFMHLSEVSAAILGKAAIPTVSLSGWDEAPPSGTPWWRAVPRLPRSASSLVSAIRGSEVSAPGVCLLGDGSTYGEALAALVGGKLGSDRIALEDEVPGGPVTAVVERIRRSACGTVGWTGFAPSVASLRTALTQADLAWIDVVGADLMKADAYLSETDGAGDGTIVTCACVDLASSTRPEAGRFIHDFQSRYGSPPGAFAAEGWDVGGMLIAVFARGATDREAVAAALTVAPQYEGLANTYRFSDAGELEPGSVRMHTYRAEGLRWVPIGESPGGGSLPVGTPGYLSVASCRSGAPFVYRTGDRLQGFDVELVAAIARRLGLTEAWSDLPCGSALAAVSAGTLDAVLAPAASVAQGTPTSGVALSLRVALVSKRTSANTDRPLVDRLGPDDVVAVVRTPETVGWAKDVLRATGARLRIVARRSDAYAGLLSDRYAALADLEPWAWAAIERRPGLTVAQSLDAGAHDVLVAKGPDAALVAALDRELGRLLRNGRYALLFAKYFPGTPIPAETGG
jgi:branched-chain amino acid transport system substrate-binding protein